MGFIADELLVGNEDKKPDDEAIQAIPIGLVTVGTVGQWLPLNNLNSISGVGLSILDPSHTHSFIPSPSGWQVLTCSPQSAEQTDRLRVEGGWLYRTKVGNSLAVTFAPH